MDLDHVESLIRQGRSKEARNLLRIQMREGPRAPFQRQEFFKSAALCRRSGWPEGGILILNPVVRPSARQVEIATPEETIEYAACLNQIGRADEALALLRSVRDEVPLKYLTAAVASFSIWDYDGAIEYLRRCLNLEGLTTYQRLIARVNLVHALVYMREMEEARPMLRELRAECLSGDHSLLLGNLFEITAHGELLAGRLNKAEEWLNFAAELLKEHTSVERIYITKWRAILTLGREGLSPATKTLIAQTVNLARDLKHWESHRDLDFYQAKILQPKGLAESLYFGTPQLAFRKRLETELQFHPPPSYVRLLGTKGGKLWRLNVNEGLNFPQEQNLKTGQIRQRLLTCLLSDFYRPMTVPVIFANLFPERYYNPVSSPLVVHQALKRLREWLEEARVPLQILEERGQYRLFTAHRVEIEIPASALSSDSAKLAAVAQLRKWFKDLSFSSADLAARAGISKRSANSRLKLLASEGTLSRESSGPRTRYVLR